MKIKHENLTPEAQAEIQRYVDDKHQTEPMKRAVLASFINDVLDIAFNQPPPHTNDIEGYLVKKDGKTVLMITNSMVACFDLGATEILERYPNPIEFHLKQSEQQPAREITNEEIENDIARLQLKIERAMDSIGSSKHYDPLDALEALVKWIGDKLKH